jgi:hypothetical protein
VNISVEPILVTIWPFLPEPRRAAVADVIVTVADDRPVADQCRDFFDRYPGLLLVLVAHPSGNLIVGMRNGLCCVLEPELVAMAVDSMRTHWDVVARLLPGGPSRVVDLGELATDG